MLATMKMRLATAWGNDVEVSLASELDNSHMLTTAEMALLMTLTLHKFCDVLQDENERVLENDPPSVHAREALEPSHKPDDDEPPPVPPSRERERLEELRPLPRD